MNHKSSNMHAVWIANHKIKKIKTSAKVQWAVSLVIANDHFCLPAGVSVGVYGSTLRTSLV